MYNIGELIALKTDEILDRWLDAIRKDRQIESTFGLSDTALGNSIPNVLKALESVLSKPTEDILEQVKDASLEHGTLRATQGYNAEEIAREYHLLRRTIFSMLKQGLLHCSAEETFDISQKIDEVLDYAVTKCFNSYVEERFVEFKQIQEQLTLTNDELSHLLETSKGNFSYLAHELKAPLTAVIGYSELLERFQPENREHKFGSRSVNVIERVLQGARHLLRIVNDALELSSFNASEIKLNIDSINICEWIERVVELMKPLAVKKELDLKVNCDRAPDSILTDGFRLQQILTNLVSNAIKYTDKGYVEIICETKGDERVSISVIDTGIGISPEDTKRIFEPYSQVYINQGRRANESTGLGLAIVAKLIELLDGEIQVSSEPDVGSTFTLILPMKLTL